MKAASLPALWGRNVGKYKSRHTPACRLCISRHRGPRDDQPPDQPPDHAPPRHAPRSVVCRCLGPSKSTCQCRGFRTRGVSSRTLRPVHRRGSRYCPALPLAHRHKGLTREAPLAIDQPPLSHMTPALRLCGSPACRGRTQRPRPAAEQPSGTVQLTPTSAHSPLGHVLGDGASATAPVCLARGPAGDPGPAAP